LSFLSHFVLDMIPHWNLGFDRNHFEENYQLSFKKKTAFFFLIDVAITLALFYIFYKDFNSELVVFGAIVAVLPDIMSLGYFTRLKDKKKYNKFIKFHNKVQRDAGFVFGMITQLIIAWILLKKIF
jgi:hypothetical protein